MKRVLVSLIGLSVILGGCSLPEKLNFKNNSSVLVGADISLTHEELLTEMISANKELVGDYIRQSTINKYLESHYEVNEEELAEQVKMMIDVNGIDSESEEEIAEFTQMIRQQMLYNELFEDKQDVLAVTEEEIVEHYENYGHELELRHILVQSQEVAEEVLNELEDGADFGELAKQFSLDGFSAEAKGLIEGYTPYYYGLDFHQKASLLEKGKINTLETEFGTHVVEVLEKKLPSLEDVKDEIETYLHGQKFDMPFIFEIISQEQDIKFQIEELEYLIDKD